MKLNTLLIPEKNDVERDAFANAWLEAGGSVMKIGKFWIKPDVSAAEATIYGNDTFSLVLAQVLGIDLVSPRDELISELSMEWTKRNIQTIAIEELSNVRFPKFIKPVKPKLFPASIVTSFHEFQSKFPDLEHNESLIISDEIKVQKEVRSFILDNQIKDLAYYEGSGDLSSAKSFIETFLSQAHQELPQTYVLDIGYNETDGWFVIEFNSCWAAGLNGCKPNLVMECMLYASSY
ncbi:MAG: ATP-grasp domain-containing protein [bacterium]|nr:ATP-grasp domain-containing protein [bacterium]